MAKVIIYEDTPFTKIITKNYVHGKTNLPLLFWANEIFKGGQEFEPMHFNLLETISGHLSIQFLSMPSPNNVVTELRVAPVCAFEGTTC